MLLKNYAEQKIKFPSDKTQLVIARKVARNAVYNSSATLIGNVSGLIITVFLARALGPDNFGIYSLSISIAFLVLVFTDLGINQTVIRYVSFALGKNNLPMLRGYIRELAKMKIVLMTISAFSLFTLSGHLAVYAFHDERLTIPIKIVSIFIFLYSLSGFLTGIFNGLNDFRANFIKSITYELFRVTSIVILVFLGYSVIGALFGFIIATLASICVLAILLFRNYGECIFGSIERIELRRVVRFTGYLTIGSIAWTVFAYVDSVMIGMFMSAEYVGYYRASYSIIGAVAGILSLPAVLFPVFVQLEGRDLENAFNRVFKYSAMLAVPASIGLPAISKEVVLAVYGSKYLAAIPVFWVLSFLILRSAVGFWGVIFNAKEKPEYPVRAILLGMVMNIALNYVMIPALGIVGAAIATLTSNVAVWSILAYLSKREFGIFFSPSHILKPVIASLIMLVFLIYATPTTILEGIAVVLVGAAIYFVSLYAVRGVGKEDLGYFLEILGR